MFVGERVRLGDEAKLTKPAVVARPHPASHAGRSWSKPGAGRKTP
jgi:hypothetical protein